MPTYVCSIAKHSISAAQKAELAEVISRIHSEETGAPSFFVQVVIDEKEAADRYLGGSGEKKHVWIRGDIRAGRTETQRNALMLRIMKEAAEVAKVDEADVWVYLNNLAPTDMVEYGHVLPQAGREAEWFDGLPKSLQNYLSGLGTSRDKFKL